MQLLPVRALEGSPEVLAEALVMQLLHRWVLVEMVQGMQVTSQVLVEARGLEFLDGFLRW